LEPTQVNKRPDAALALLLDLAQERFRLKLREIDAESAARTKELSHLKCGCMGRAAKRLEIAETFALKRARARIKTYKGVVDQSGRHELLSADLLDHLRTEIARWIMNGFQRFQDASERDCRAAGEWDKPAWEALVFQHTQTAKRVAAAAVSELRGLELEGRLNWQRAIMAVAAEPVSTKVRAQGLRKRRLNPALQRLKSKVCKLLDEGCSHKEICDRLDKDERPPHVGWRHLTWPNAYRKHRAAVAKWISDARR